MGEISTVARSVMGRRPKTITQAEVTTLHDDFRFTPKPDTEVDFSGKGNEPAPQ
jgi:hypothetical protein